MSLVVANNYRISFAPDAVKEAKYSLSRLQTNGTKAHFALMALYDSKVLLVRDIISDSLFRLVFSRDVDSVTQICDITESIVQECQLVFLLLDSKDSQS
ncbi:DUF5405 family protein [Dryocola sp. BD626]|uniref:DUF5405 family protein n=1 Tax=Dryocola sp. BD626 TaxID=3133273 RepID=UPI003F507BD5